MPMDRERETYARDPPNRFPAPARRGRRTPPISQSTLHLKRPTAAIPEDPMTKHTSKLAGLPPDEAVRSLLNSQNAAFTVERLLKTSDKVEAEKHVDEDLVSTLYAMRDMSIDMLALAPPVGHKHAALCAGALSHQFELLTAGGWPSPFAKQQAEVRARLLLDDLIRHLLAHADATAQEIGLDRFWTEEGSIMGRIDKAAGGAD